jgi:hypothetical protein
LNSLPPFPSGSINCPSGVGNEIVILPLRYGRNVGTVEVELDTCFEVMAGPRFSVHRV